MLILALGEVLEKIEEEQVLEEERPAVIITDFKHAGEAMGLAGMLYEGELNLSPKDIGFCKLEAQQECLAGSLCIP